MENIIWLNKANTDLIEIYNYIAKDSLYYAKKTIDEIIKKVEILSDFPYIGEKINNIFNGEYRKLIYKSYKIIYEIDSNKIYIHRVWHSARKTEIFFLN